MTHIGVLLGLALALVASCGGDSTDRTEVAEPSTTMATTTATPEDEPTEDELAGVEPLPLLTEHPAPPPLPPAGCRFRNVEGELGAVVPGIDFRVTFRSGQARFHQGETVGLALSFAARPANQFKLDAAEYDRAGRLQIDEYALEPSDGAVDPLADYFDRGQIEMGGIREMPMLGPVPRVIERDLDEYLALLRPGRYRLRVASQRITRERDNASIVCAIDALDLEILPPDDARNARAVTAAVRVLERPGPSTDAQEAAKRAAARTLRFLRTEAAADAMVTLLTTPAGEEWSGELVFGLFGSPHRERIVARMRETLTGADTQITTSFFDTLSRLAAKLEQPGYLPPWPDDEPSQLRWRRAEALYEARQGAAEDREASSLLASLPQKRGAANDVAFATLLEIAFRSEHAPPWIGELRSQIGARLPTMEQSAQERFLRDRWMQVADASLIGPLRGMADAEGSTPEARSLALSRLFELAPAEGQRRIEAEVRRVPVRLGYMARDVLSLLVGPVPALDDALAAGAERHDYEEDLRARLLPRYGTVAILARVRAGLATRRDRSSSEAEGAYLAYFLRVDRDRTVRDLAARAGAISTDLDRSIFVATLTSAAEYLWDPAIQEHLVAALSSHDASTVVDAAHALRDHASSPAEAAIWTRLEAHHAEYRRRTSEALVGEPWQIEAGLVSALLAGQSWHLDRAELERLRGLCFSESTLNNVDSELRNADGPVSVTIFLQESGTLTVQAGMFHQDSRVEPVLPLTAGPGRLFVLENAPGRAPRGVRRVRARALDALLVRLAQVPRGTEVRVGILPDDQAGARELRASLARWLGQHGLRVGSE